MKLRITCIHVQMLNYCYIGAEANSHSLFPVPFSYIAIGFHTVAKWVTGQADLSTHILATCIQVTIFFSLWVRLASPSGKKKYIVMN